MDNVILIFLASLLIGLLAGTTTNNPLIGIGAFLGIQLLLIALTE